jgi:hypothetical protein
LLAVAVVKTQHKVALETLAVVQVVVQAVLYLVEQTIGESQVALLALTALAVVVVFNPLLLELQAVMAAMEFQVVALVLVLRQVLKQMLAARVEMV